MASKLKIERVTQDLTQRELAKRAGVSQTTLSCIETGAQPARSRRARLAVAKAVGRRADELFDD